MDTNHRSDRPNVQEGYIPVENARLYYRQIGKGQPVIILHGGPDFNHDYFLPEMDRLSDICRLIYYDQRGRGKSSGNVRPAEVSLRSELKDLEMVRNYFRLETVAVLGHSWGGIIAMEYALGYPQRVSQLILMNTAPASREDYLLFRQQRAKDTPEVVEKLKSLSVTSEYKAGELEADAEYYRVHFKDTLKQPEQLERVIKSLRSSFTPEDILKARAIEDRLMDETWLSAEFSLIPQLQQLNIPALVIHGDDDFVPLECATHIAQAIPGARLVLLKDSGHFSFLESPTQVHRAISDFFHRA